MKITILCASLALAGLANASSYTLAGASGSLSGSSLYGWDGSELAPFVGALADGANFGSAGTVHTSVVTTTLNDTNNFSGVNGFVSPWWFNSSATATQVNQVVNFFMGGGDLVLLDDSSVNDPVAAALGLPTVDGAGSTWTGSGPLFNGPFGAAGSVSSFFEIGFFNPTDISSHGGSVGATDGAGNITAAYWAAHTYCSTCGAIVLTGDIDTWTTGATYGPLNGNGAFALNSIAFLINNSGSASATPEPATMALLGAGLIGLGIFRRSKTRRS